jgi:signal peptidase II
MPRLPRTYLLYGGIIILACIDVILKILAIKNKLPQIRTGAINISYFANPGIAFSLPLPQTLTLIITGVLIVIFVLSYVRTRIPAIRLALLCALLGAISNFLDRLLTGFTTDYIILFSRSAINIADILIFTGVGYCAWYYQKADIAKRAS